MPDADRDKWNRRYSVAGDAPERPSSLLVEMAQFLPKTGRALDLAGGAGRHAIWLAKRGLQVTLADISSHGLAIARARALEAGVDVETVELDLELDQMPRGPWDLIVSFHFLCRPLFERIPRVLASNGRLLVVQPTVSNLQRHAKPPARFLLNDGELPGLVQGLNVLHYQEGWSSEGRHDAVIVCQQITSPNPPATCASR